ncbi:uncharacterized protein PAC_05061 [Phialocephala subalpina]|uniref:2EXR domain-containing protein n=1 Tax=Phialocephala subalpina TaxID=576137 RepID=A0A1L7WQZ7_9HELO|nr:uncharacterized protein PAC_05061 [Phialocephala subalpina]
MTEAEKLPPETVDSGPANTPDAVQYIDETPASKSDTASAPTTSDSATSETLMTNDTFTLFSKLPIELRLKIWDDAIPEARIIEVMWSEERGFYTDSKSPAILHVCSDSRACARKVYTAAIVENSRKHVLWGAGIASYAPQINGNGPYKNGTTPFGAWISYDYDTLYFSLGNSNMFRNQWCDLAKLFFTKLSQNKFVRLQNIAINHCEIMEWNHNWGLWLSGHSLLRSIALVVNDECMPHFGGLLVNTAPQRPAVEIKQKDLDAEPAHDATRWDNDLAKVQRKAYGMTWNGLLLYEIPNFMEDLIYGGMAEEVVEKIEFAFIDIVRGEAGK